MGLLNDFSPGGGAVDISSTDHTFTLPVGVRCDVAGTFKVDTVDGTTFVSGTMAAGEILPWAIKKVYKTGTAATLHWIRLP